MMKWTAAELAQKIIVTLDKQRDYFKSRSTDTLRESKRLEQELRQMANEILHPEQVQPTLFQPEEK